MSELGLVRWLETYRSIGEMHAPGLARIATNPTNLPALYDWPDQDQTALNPTSGSLRARDASVLPVVLNETFIGTPGDDVLIGTEGNDALFGEDGDDVIRGGDGLDNIYTGFGQDRAYGNAGNDYLRSHYTAGNVLYGQAGDDYFESQHSAIAGANILVGGAGNDTFRVSPNDVVFMGAGQDTVSLTLARSLASDPGTGRTGGLTGFQQGAVIVRDFQTGPDGDVFAGLPVPADNYSPTRYFGFEFIQLLENFQGSNPFGTGHLQLLQVEDNTELRLDIDGGGDDYMTIVVFESTQADEFTSDNFNGFAPDGGDFAGRTMEGDEGLDRLDGTPGDDYINGHGYGDFLNGYSGNDTLYGEAGEDVIEGGMGRDFIYGGRRDDVLSDRDGGGAIFGGGGNDTIYSWVWGNVEDTRLAGGIGDDSFHVSPGDIVSTGDGADRIIFGLRDLSLWENRRLFIGDFDVSGGDRLLLGTLLEGLSNYNGDNPFGTGHLRLVQAGNNVRIDVDIDGGGDEFRELVRFNNADIADFTEASLGGFNPDGSSVPGEHLVAVGGGPRDRTYTNGGHGHDLLEGRVTDLWESYDVLNGKAGNDIIYGYDGNDIIYGGVGDDVVYGGPGRDEIWEYDGGNELRGGADGDRIHSIHDGSDGGNVIYGGGGLDRIFVSHLDIVSTGRGRDKIFLGEYDQYSLDYIEQGLTPWAPPDPNWAIGDRFTLTDFDTGNGGDIIVGIRYAIFDQLSNFQGSNPFESGHMRVRQDGDDTVVEINQDGIGADFEEFIRILDTGADALTAFNFNGLDPTNPSEPPEMVAEAAILAAASDTRPVGLAISPALQGEDGFWMLPDWDSDLWQA